MRKILIVDDERMQRQMLKGLLEIEGYEVIIAENGKRGLETIKTMKPDLVVTDMKVPVMDGMEFLNTIKASDICKTVIILTGHGTPENEKVAFSKGAFAYLHKPVDFNDLLGIIATSGVNHHRILIKLFDFKEIAKKSLPNLRHFQFN